MCQSHTCFALSVCFFPSVRQTLSYPAAPAITEEPQSICPPRLTLEGRLSQPLATDLTAGEKLIPPTITNHVMSKQGYGAAPIKERDSGTDLWALCQIQPGWVTFVMIFNDAHRHQYGPKIDPITKRLRKYAQWIIWHYTNLVTNVCCVKNKIESGYTKNIRSHALSKPT